CNRVSHHESGTTGGIVRWFTASSLCVFQRNLDHPKPDGRGINISGVDFWHAVEFSRNGRFLRTHPLGLSSGALPFGVSVSDSIRPLRSDFLGAFQVDAFRVSLSGGPDFIRRSRSDFPPRQRLAPTREAVGFPIGGSCKRTGAGRPDANR